MRLLNQQFPGRLMLAAASLPMLLIFPLCSESSGLSSVQTNQSQNRLNHLVAQASQREIEIVNETGSGLVELYISSSTSNTWGSELLLTNQSGSIERGESKIIEYPAGQGCRYDILAVFRNGVVFENFNVQLCDAARYTFR